MDSINIIWPLSFVLLLASCTKEEPKKEVVSNDCAEKIWSVEGESGASTVKGLVRIHDGLLELKVTPQSGMNSYLGVYQPASLGVTGDFEVVVNYTNFESDDDSANYAMVGLYPSLMAFISKKKTTLSAGISGVINNKVDTVLGSSTNGYFKFKRTGNVAWVSTFVGGNEVFISHDSIGTGPMFLKITAFAGPNVSAPSTIFSVGSLKVTGSGLKSDEFDCNSIK